MLLAEKEKKEEKGRVWMFLEACGRKLTWLVSQQDIVMIGSIPMSGHRVPPQLSPETLHALTHLLTTPATPTPDLHSQFLISTLLHPSALPSHYPPLHSPSASLHLGHGIRLFLRRISPFNSPTTSWRSTCPYQQPPPSVLARGLEEARWGDNERRAYVRARLRRKRLGSDVHPLVPFLIPNLLLFSLLFWDPVIPDRC